MAEKKETWVGEPNQIYNAVCGKSEKLGENSPHNILLKEANFTYFQDKTKPATMGNPSQYSIIKAVVLKSKKTWLVFEKFLHKYIDADIPNNEVKKAISSVQEIRKEETPAKIRKEVNRRLALHKT